ncbi:TPM domain-containing protein [Gordonia sp. TBRC 11910]|uniref:TPM domain-containing protein n=1 Tax=Gordonia asplenii TaxID=2725283 RepID=A0A848L773_9ACTN|nr:TPM domain-containing protein [Gordonia asplenii]NMO03448.1 TPM domain-containing protein [Gordonia asplenii]
MGLRTGLPLLAALQRLLAASVLAVLTVGLAAMALAMATVGAAPARADEPTRLQQSVLDTANALTNQQHANLQSTIDKLYADNQVQLWVVYVHDFGNLSAQDWAARTASMSDLGTGDVLLAVATDSRSYYLNASGSIDGLSSAKLTTVASKFVEPQLHQGNWAQAGIEAANGITDQLQPSHTGLIVGSALGGLLVVGGGGAYLYTRRTRRRKNEEAIEALRDSEEELTADQLSAQPLSVLDPWASEVLTDTDNAVATSADELALAESEFGTVETAPFRHAVEAARAGLATSYALRQRLDDAIPETDDERRSMLVQIITTCTDLDAALDEQASNFDEMRNLLINADTRFDELTRELVAAQARVAAAGPLLADLTSKYGADALTSIAHNIELAAEQITFADDSADQGREAIAAPVGKQGPAVAAIRSAEGALTQANRLLDAISNAEANLRAARTQLPALITEVEGEIAEAQALAARGDGAADLTTAIAAAQTSLTSARTGAVNDLLGSFTELVQADAALDAALAGARQRSSERVRRSELLTASMTAASAKVSAAVDFIETRRGAVQATARTRLAEAQRLLDQAQRSTGGTPEDIATMTDLARRAGSLADQALMAAQADVVSWQNAESTNLTSDSSTAGAVLAGVLVDSFLRGAAGRPGGFDGGFGGGFSSGGRSPGSFGGTGTAGRIGVGGRF